MEEVGFEPMARSSSSKAVRERPTLAQKAYGTSTEVQIDTLLSAVSAVHIGVTNAVKNKLLMSSYNSYDNAF